MNNKFYIEKADEKLKEICSQGIKEKFGDNPPEAVKTRLDNELNILSKNGFSDIMLLGIMIAKEAKRVHQSIFFTGTITSTLISYVSGMSMINPMNKEYGGIGLDLTVTGYEKGVEPTLNIECGQIFVLILQAFLTKQFPDYHILVQPEQSTDSVYLIFANKDDFEKEDIQEWNDFKDNKFFIMLSTDEHMLTVTNREYNNSPLSEGEEQNMYKEVWAHYIDNWAMAPNYTDIEVNSYDELITAIGLMYAFSNQEVHDLSHVIGTRDDVYDYCLKLGIDVQTSDEIMTYVRKGRASRSGFSEKHMSILKEHGAEDWFITWCQSVMYLIPKATVVQMIRKYAYASI